LYSGTPVRRSHTTVVSRWLVMPMAARSRGLSPPPRNAAAMTVWVLRQIATGSCSTHPGWGKICSCSICDSATMRVDSSKTMKRVLLVP
jgi:hypothetical protein